VKVVLLAVVVLLLFLTQTDRRKPKEEAPHKKKKGGGGVKEAMMIKRNLQSDGLALASRMMRMVFKVLGIVHLSKFYFIELCFVLVFDSLICFLFLNIQTCTLLLWVFTKVCLSCGANCNMLYRNWNIIYELWISWQVGEHQEDFVVGDKNWKMRFEFIHGWCCSSRVIDMVGW